MKFSVQQQSSRRIAIIDVQISVMKVICVPSGSVASTEDMMSCQTIPRIPLNRDLPAALEESERLPLFHKMREMMNALARFHSVLDVFILAR